MLVETSDKFCPASFESEAVGASRKSLRRSRSFPNPPPISLLPLCRLTRERLLLTCFFSSYSSYFDSRSPSPPPPLTLLSLSVRAHATRSFSIVIYFASPISLGQDYTVWVCYLLPRLASRQRLFFLFCLVSFFPDFFILPPRAEAARSASSASASERRRHASPQRYNARARLCLAGHVYRCAGLNSDGFKRASLKPTFLS